MNRTPRPLLLDVTPETVVAGRLLTEYVELYHHRDHTHNTDGVVGYVVRETIRERNILWGEDFGTCGYDVQAVEGGHRYGDTFPLRDVYRDRPGGYAVVDRLYRCGCRSGLPIPQPGVAVCR